MLYNYHTHTVFCDGNDTAEEMVLTAIEKGFESLGFSGHYTTDFDMRYCMHDIPAYINEIKRLKEKYKKEIEIYLGIEEDSYQLCERTQFEYMIGSCHCVKKDGKIYPLDNSLEEFMDIMKVFGNNPLALAETYYKDYCDYILSRKPDIVGHFDLITKYEESGGPLFLNNKEYNKIAEKYLKAALKSDCIFEINTGAISRGYRTAPYPSENLLYIMKQNDAKIILSSDCHARENLDCFFSEARELLKDIGFKESYVLLNNEFVKQKL